VEEEIDLVEVKDLILCEREEVYNLAVEIVSWEN
jgi:hypothetical protein